MATVKIAIEDHIGKEYGRLTILESAGSRSGVGRLVKCRCSCGKILPRVFYQLLSGVTKSCGCLNVEQLKQLAKKHGRSGDPEYLIWKGVRSRCRIKSATGYYRYGGRGLYVCKPWNKYENFIEDMGPRPSAKHSIERRNNNIGYRPSNCYWATDAEQRANKEHTIRIKIGKSVRTLRQWADYYNTRRSVVYHRICLLGWDPLTALTTPIKAKNQKIELRGQMKTLVEWCSYSGVKTTTARAQLKRGVPLELVFKGEGVV